MTALLALMTTLAAGSYPRVIMPQPGGLAFVPERKLVVDPDGGLNVATCELAVDGPRGRRAEVWTAAGSTLVLCRDDSEHLSAAFYDQRSRAARRFPVPPVPSPDSPAVERAVCLPVADAFPLGDFGIAVQRQPGGAYLLITNDGLAWVDALPPLRGPVDPMRRFLLPDGATWPSSGGVPLPDRFEVAAASEYASVVAGWSEDGGRGRRFGVLSAAKSGDWEERFSSRRGPDWVLGIYGVSVLALGPSEQGLLAPWAIDAVAGRDLADGRGWLTSRPGPATRASLRASGLWLEWGGLAVQPSTGETRVCWDDPGLWAPSPDGKWAATVDTYRSAHPSAWVPGKPAPEPEEAWLTVCMAGVEWEAPAMRPFVRWTQPVHVGRRDSDVTARLRPLWSHDGALLVCGRYMFDAATGAVRTELPGRLPWPLAFARDGRLVWVDAGEERLSVYAWMPDQGRNETLSLPKAARE